MEYEEDLSVYCYVCFGEADDTDNRLKEVSCSCKNAHIHDDCLLNLLKDKPNKCLVCNSPFANIQTVSTRDCTLEESYMRHLQFLFVWSLYCYIGYTSLIDTRLSSYFIQVWFIIFALGILVIGIAQYFESNLITYNTVVYMN